MQQTRTDRGNAVVSIDFTGGQNLVNAGELRLVIEEAVAKSLGTVTGNVTVRLQGVALVQVTEVTEDATYPEWSGNGQNGTIVTFNGATYRNVSKFGIPEADGGYGEKMRCFCPPDNEPAEGRSHWERLECSA